MKVFPLAALVCGVVFAQAPSPTAYYKFTPDAFPQDGVPRGAVRGPFTLPSQAYPGTQHTYWVYVPAQYDPSTPTSLMIFQDGQAFMAPNGDVRAQFVMDNLIWRREIPVMIGVFIDPGRRPDQPEPRIAKERSRGLTLDSSIPESASTRSNGWRSWRGIQERFGGRFPEEVLPQLDTCRDVVDAVEKYLGKASRPAEQDRSARGSGRILPFGSLPGIRCAQTKA